MNTDYQDIKSYRKQIFVEICENLCPDLFRIHFGKAGFFKEVTSPIGHGRIAYLCSFFK
jgi:hypothetical protein